MTHQNEQKHSLDVLTIELESAQKECDRIKEKHTKAIAELQSKHQSHQAKDFELQQENSTQELETLISEKQAQVKALQDDIKESTEAKKPGGADLTDTWVGCFREIANSRKESIARLEQDYGKYEAAMTQHESIFMRLASANPTSRSESQPAILSPISGRRPRIEGSPASRRKTPTLVEPRRTKTTM